MDFGKVNAEFASLRNLATSFVGDNALREVSMRPPASSDEASFLRLVSWSYALVFESGRITIPYLIKLPAAHELSGAECGEACQLVHDLRSWSSHNLGFDDERGMTTIRRVNMWFIETCGVAPPSSSEDWANCFEILCGEVYGVLRHCTGALSLAMNSPEDRRSVVADLRHRLDRQWPASKFDELVSDAAARIGQSLDVQRFRHDKLERWRSFLFSVPDHDQPHERLVRLIERDVLDHFESVLPIDGNDVMEHLDIPPGRMVGDALTSARRLFRLGIRDRDDLLSRLLEEYRADGRDSAS